MRGTKKTLLVLIAITAVVFSGLAITAHAAGVLGGFEIDGNKVDDPGTGVDWLTPNLGAVVFNDPEASSGCGTEDDNFIGGGSKELTPGTWTFDCGNVPSKDDFTEAGIYTTKVDNSNWLFLYFNRVSGNGEAHLNFEFNQLPTTFDNDNDPATPEVPERSTGDILIVLDATNGGSVTKPGIFRWTGTRTSGTWGSTGGTQVQGVDWDVATDGSGDRFHFAEVAIRLQAFNVSPSCPGLGKAWVKSNSTALGADFTGGVLKDRTARKDVPLNNCAHKNWEFTVNPYGIAGSKVYAVYTVATNPASTRTLELTLGADGKTYTGSDAQIPPGDVTYHFEVRNGSDVIYSSTPATETFAAEETKTNSGSLTYDITLSPEDAENFSDTFAGSPQPHELTAKVFNTANDAGLPFVPVTFANEGSCGTLSTTSGTTDANGEAKTTLTSSAPCSTTIRAWVNGTGPGATAGFDTGEASDTATKRFVSYALSVSPESVENETETDHTFTVTLTKDSGSGSAAVSGASVSVSLDPGTTGAVITAIPGGAIAADGLSGTCTTDANGQCTVTIHGTSPGTARLTASTTVADSDNNTITINNHGDKQFSAFDLDVTPPSATNEVDTDHTFTVTLTRDTGSGPAGISGASVAITLDPGTTGAIITAIPGGTIAADKLSGTCITDANGQCTVTIHGTSSGTATLTADWSQELSGGGTVVRSKSATKQFLDFTLDVTPPSANNLVGQPHEFTVTLKQDSGSGLVGLPGETVHLVLTGPANSDGHFTSINGQPAVGTVADCVTRPDDPQTPADEAGTCSVIMTSTTTGTYTLTATWENTTIVEGGASETDSATKNYLSIGVTKTSCPVDTSPRGGIVDWTVSFAVDGNGLTNATFKDDLPDNVTFVSASPINGVTPTTPAVGAEDGTVTWTFPSIAAGTYSGTVRVAITEDAPFGTITNTVTLDADEIAPMTATDDITVGDGGREADGRAYGINLDLLGSEIIAPTPDSNDTNPGEVLAIPDPFGSATPLLTLLSVSESDDSTANQAAHSATATALNVDLNVPGVLHLQASSVVAKTTSQASASGAGSSRGGSLIQNLVINDHEYGNVSEPTTVNVLDPLSGDVLAEVHLLETTRTGAAAGGTQPDGNLFSSGLAVNGIHVKVHALDLVDLIVSHSDTKASFPSGLGCGGSIPSVSGSGYALGVNLKPDSPDGIDLGNVKVAQVNLPSTGGQDDAVLANVDVPDIVKATAAEAHTTGEITDKDGDGIPVEAHTLARTAGLNLLDGTITARVIEATSDSTLGSSSGSTTIAELIIGGTDVCAALGLDSLCKPAPNTELIIPDGPVIVELNEQIPEPGGLTVNAVHIWVLGKGNPLGLPVGADIVISSAHSDAHGAGESNGAAIDDRVTTINVKALSSPTALRLKQLQRTKPIQVPVATPLLPEAPVLRVPDVLRDPVSVLDELNSLPVADDVIEDATKLVETLTDPEALLEALSDPAVLIEGLTDPAAAIDALAQAIGVTPEEASTDTAEATVVQQIEAFLRKAAQL